MLSTFIDYGNLQYFYNVNIKILLAQTYETFFGYHM
jgi:hypothetical protein